MPNRKGRAAGSPDIYQLLYLILNIKKGQVYFAHFINKQGDKIF